MRLVYAEHVCISCNKALSFIERMYSDGVCPHCGHITNATICASRKRAYRMKTTGWLWWKVTEKIYLNETPPGVSP